MGDEKTVNTNLPLRNPIIIHGERRPYANMVLSPEDRTYFILFNLMEDEETHMVKVIGRINTYRAVERLLVRYQDDGLDPRDMTILVEYIVRDKDNDRYEYALMHPDNPRAKTAYQFCRDMEHIVGDTAFDLESYTDSREYDSANEANTKKFNAAANTIDLNAFDGNAEMANTYMSAMNDKEKNTTSTENLFAMPQVNPFDDGESNRV